MTLALVMIGTLSDAEPFPAVSSVPLVWVSTVLFADPMGPKIPSPTLVYQLNYLNQGELE